MLKDLVKLLSLLSMWSGDRLGRRKEKRKEEKSSFQTLHFNKRQILMRCGSGDTNENVAAAVGRALSAAAETVTRVPVVLENASYEFMMQHYSG